MISIETRMGIVKDGKVVVPFEYERIEPAIVDGKESDVLFKIKKNGIEGIVKYNKFEETYSYRTDNIVCVSDFEDDVAIITMVPEQGCAKYALMDTNLNIKSDLEYIHIRRIGRGYFEACKLRTTDIINSCGAVLFENVVPATLNAIRSDKIYITEDNGQFGLIKIKDDTVIEVDNDFNSISKFNNGVSIVTVKYDFGIRYGLLDTKFDELLEPIYDDIIMFDSDLYSVRVKDKYGVYSVKQKQMIIPIKFKSVTLSSSGYKTTKISVEVEYKK